MSPSLLMLAAFTAGQPIPSAPPRQMPAAPTAMPYVAAPFTQVQNPPMALPGTTAEHPHAIPGQPTTPFTNPFPQEAEKSAPSPEAAADEDKEDKWAIMRALDGTSLGTLMGDRRFSVSGWTQMSFTGTNNTKTTNQPMVWNDRANSFLLNQVWLRFEKAVDTEAKEATWGWRADNVFGSDYRFSLMRGFLTSQLKNSNPQTVPEPQQNLYGYDLIQFYGNVYLPNLFEGTDIRAGRLFTPFGYESLEGVSTPFVSRSYAFNWCPPFTHMGIMMSPKFSDKLSAKMMIANGNDVFFSGAQEIRYVGALTWTPNDKNTVTFGTSVGRGKFDTSSPFNPQTIGLQTEPAGRNNINVFDLVWGHTINDDWSYAFEAIYGYQYGVPANVAGGIVDTRKGVGQPGTAHWGSIVNYLNYKVCDQLTAVGRFELFDDFEGQRTGFEGLYTSITGGLQYTPIPDLILRPQVRYDYNNQSRPFNGNRDLWSAAMEMIVRY